MNNTQLMWNWINDTGAKSKLGSLDRAKSVAAQLINAHTQFVKTGRWQRVDQELYDYHHFLHCFADHIAGRDDNLYKWLLEKAEIMLRMRQAGEKSSERALFWCSMCSSRVSFDKVARRFDGSVRWTAKGHVWCQKCADLLDRRTDSIM